MTEGVLPGPLSAAAQVPAARARRRTRSQIFTDGMPPAAPAAAGTGGRSGTGGTGHVGGTGSAADISDVTDAGSGTDSGGDDGISGTGTSHTGDAEGPGGASATGRATRAAEPRHAGAAARSAQTSRRLILAAERLYAERGLDGVSLRQISTAAGGGNNNAVQYHFGDRDGLIRAIITHRLPAIDHRRAELLAAATAAGLERDVPTLIDVLIRPLAEEARKPSNHYVAFIGRISMYPDELNPWLAGGQPASGIAFGVAQAIMDELTQLAQPLRSLRLRHVTALCLTALAGHDLTQAAPDLPYGEFVADLLSMAAAALLAPPAGR